MAEVGLRQPFKKVHQSFWDPVFNAFLLKNFGKILAPIANPPRSSGRWEAEGSLQVYGSGLFVFQIFDSLSEKNEANFLFLKNGFYFIFFFVGSKNTFFSLDGIFLLKEMGGRKGFIFPMVFSLISQGTISHPRTFILVGCWAFGNVIFLRCRKGSMEVSKIVGCKIWLHF